VATMDRFPRVPAGWLAGCALTLVCPFAASAASVPSYATGGDETIHGTIATLTGKYTLTLSDDRGFTDSVTLHDGTVIAPTGVTLETGQEVTIVGHTDGKTFDADEVDTDGAEPYDSGPAAAYYSGAYAAGVSPPYILPIGNGGYYYGNAFGFGGYGGYGGYYYSNPGFSSSSGTVTAHGSSTPIVPPASGHYTPIAHPPIGHPHAPSAPRLGSSGSFGGGVTSSSHGSGSSSHH